MRLLLKIFAAPLIAALALLVWICSGLLYCTAFIFGLAGTIVAILGVAVLVTYSVQKNGIILLVIAFSSLPWDCLWLRRGCWESSRPCAIPFRTGFTDKSNKTATLKKRGAVSYNVRAKEGSMVCEVK